MAFGRVVDQIWHDYRAFGDRTTWTYDNTYQLTREHRSGPVSFDVNPGGATLLDSQGVGTILDDDSTAEEYESTDTPLPIADAHPKRGAKTTTSELFIDSSEFIASLDLVISIDDGTTDVGDLTATLASPSNPENPVDVTPLVSGTKTYPAFGFGDEGLGGTWKLSITDDTKGNTHTLNSWSIVVTYATPLGGTFTPTFTTESAAGVVDTEGLPLFVAARLDRPSSGGILASTGMSENARLSLNYSRDETGSASLSPGEPAYDRAVDQVMAVLARPSDQNEEGPQSELELVLNDIDDVILEDLAAPLIQ